MSSSSSSSSGSSKESSIAEPCICYEPGCAYYYITGERIGQEGTIWEAWVCYRSMETTSASGCDPPPMNDPNMTGLVWILDDVLRCDLGSNVWMTALELCRTLDDNSDPSYSTPCSPPV